ncbi:MAG: hypothetical protein A3C30_05225 [Candidatus Levybacteria bacterium RIFCSPHIGHO2_02_FULL_40_18]|nr:MAG: hypothetical protein A2869_02885 [Candidatus Levybacteria bacterium RIFCSPHIGHO2_01_FULL_40_58]OGH26476.1 MAG: hypothetical protein A3C30_05225 [Candidatus Levybacteria bacterium RIFCSPHIGHO2_02_FULL_40_18]OGH31924.1 MAG: hypothetical protein A3E43_01025 [Candidatus Levybacteria bacterium RIFCSPHIGHO2_12_FULL_40_31]OGH40193.1 MAG: hypothetical protein A2894_05120 [Candidatus Levybacteria bacterium RIFCSPLOWO2_01_FULL_40_64]OGH49317.1 MAG: hypothetical protein A3I54_01570 [Candidatus Lev
MSKKRKTRSQKIIAATRRNNLSNITEILPSLSIEYPAQANHAIEPKTYAKTYAYVLQDARKTFLVISIIAALNIILFLILKLKVINLFGLVF